jgi:hypothetical protein
MMHPQTEKINHLYWYTDEVTGVVVLIPVESKPNTNSERSARFPIIKLHIMNPISITENEFC